MQNESIDQLTNTLIGLINDVKTDKITIVKARMINSLACTAIKSNLSLMISHQSIQNKKLALREREIELKGRNLKLREQIMLS